MATMKKFLETLSRLPLLFAIDSVLRGSFLDFSGLPLGPLSSSLQPENLFDFTFSGNSTSREQAIGFLSSIVWFQLLGTVIIICGILVCCSVETLLDVYSCIFGVACLILSYKCNTKLLLGDENLRDEDLSVEDTETLNLDPYINQSSHMSLFLNVFMQALIVLGFDKLCVTRISKWDQRLRKLSRYPVDIILFMSFTLPVLGDSLMVGHMKLSRIILSLALVLPGSLLSVHSMFVTLSVLRVVLRTMRRTKVHIREVGIDGVFLQAIEKTNLAWLLRSFFLFRLSYQIFTSKTVVKYQEVTVTDLDESLNFLRMFTYEMLFELSGTLLSIMGMASIISIISGVCLRVVYSIIGGRDEEEHMQPAVSGFLFILLAMQTGLTSVESGVRLKLLLQNCILLLVANQHFVQTLTGDLMQKASAEDFSFRKHIRPMLPYFLFFSFPFLVISRLWEYPFRLSWLLAITAFTIELVIKSLTSLLVYFINMVHSHTNYLHDHIDDILFYIKAVSGCLNFACGVFLFINGAYIFLFESGGIIRLTMMVIHFYWNIVQTAIKGWKTLKLRRSAWDKVKHLQQASQEQLDENADVCSICYQEMTEAVVIKCSHVFHKGCLKKWLTIQERCPLCHALLEDPSSANDTSDDDIE